MSTYAMMGVGCSAILNFVEVERCLERSLIGNKTNRNAGNQKGFFTSYGWRVVGGSGIGCKRRSRAVVGSSVEGRSNVEERFSVEEKRSVVGGAVLRKGVESRNGGRQFRRI